MNPCKWGNFDFFFIFADNVKKKIFFHIYPLKIVNTCYTCHAVHRQKKNVGLREQAAKFICSLHNDIDNVIVSNQ